VAYLRWKLLSDLSLGKVGNQKDVPSPGLVYSQKTTRQLWFNFRGQEGTWSLIGVVDGLWPRGWRGKGFSPLELGGLKAGLKGEGSFGTLEGPAW